MRAGVPACDEKGVLALEDGKSGHGGGASLEIYGYLAPEDPGGDGTGECGWLVHCVSSELLAAGERAGIREEPRAGCRRRESTQGGSALPRSGGSVADEGLTVKEKIAIHVCFFWSRPGTRRGRHKKTSKA